MRGLLVFVDLCSKLITSQQIQNRSSFLADAWEVQFLGVRFLSFIDDEAATDSDILCFYGSQALNEGAAPCASVLAVAEGAVQSPEAREVQASVSVILAAPSCGRKGRA